MRQRTLWPTADVSLLLLFLRQSFSAIHRLLFAAAYVHTRVLCSPSKCITDPMDFLDWNGTPRQCSIELSSSLSQPASIVLPDDSVCWCVSLH